MDSSLKSFMESTLDGVFYVGHASALARINSKLILFDPVWNHEPYDKYWKFIPEQVNCDEILDKVDACFISHIHEDHVCDRIIAKLKYTCEVFIMDGRPNLTDRLRKLDAQVYRMTPKMWHGTGGLGFEFYFVPHAFNSIDSSVFIRNPETGFTIYHGNDNFLCESALVQLCKDVPRVDIAMVPYAFIHWYPALMKNMSGAEKYVETRRLQRQSFAQFDSFLKYMLPKRIIPFGNNLFYNGGAAHILNQMLPMPHDLDIGPLITGGMILSDGVSDGLSSSAEGYRDYVTEHLGTDPHPKMVLWSQDKHSPDIIAMINAKISTAEKIPDNLLIISGLNIDLQTIRVTRPCTVKRNFKTIFNLDAPIFGKWKRGEITFEQAIGTRRFECIRSPNIYNLKVFEFMNNFL